MAIEIIDGFKLSRLSPIDDRIVASGSTARNAIAYKYQGLRVYDTFDSTPYVWMGNNWIKESQFSLSVPSNVTLIKTTNVIGSGTSVTGQVLKVFDSGSKLLTNSIISETIFYNSLGNQIGQGTVGIGYTTPPNDSGIRLDVNGTVKATSFVGSGANINNIDPQNLNTTINKIQISQIEPGGVSSANYVLRTNALGTSLEWTNVNTLVQPNTISTSIDVTTATQNYIPFVPQLNGGLLKVNNSTLAFIPATSQLILKNTNTPNTPALSFNGDTNTGIYRPADKSIGFSTNGSNRVTIDTVGIKITPGTSTNLGFSFIGANNHGFYQATNLIGFVINGTERLTIANTGLTINADSNLLKLKGTTTAYIELYRTGGSTPTGYIGYNSSTLNQLIIRNDYTSGLSNTITLADSGKVNISSISTSGYGVQISNLSGNSGNGLAIVSSFTSAQIATPSGCNVAAFISRSGTSGADSYHLWITRQGVELAGSNGTGGTEALPSIYVSGKATTGIYSPTSEYSGDALAITAGGGTKIIINKNGVKMAAFVSQDLLGQGAPSVNNISNSGNANNTFNGSNSACINAVYKTLTSNSGAYTARWYRLGFKFNNYTGSSKSSQYVTFPSDTCDRIFYCGSGGNSPGNWYGYEAKFYIGGYGNGNYLGRFLSNTGSSESIYTGSGTFYVPANHIFTIVFEWYANGSAVNDTSTEGGFAMEVRAFRMGLSNVLNNGSF